MPTTIESTKGSITRPAPAPAPAPAPVQASTPAPAPAPAPEPGPGGSIKLANPVPEARVSSHFARSPEQVQQEGRVHPGLDLAIGQGTPIKAAAAGTVAEVRNEPDGFGNYITIDHGDGRYTRYAHMVDRSPLNEGDSVAAGQEIGQVGSTGNSTGPHLHFEVLIGGLGSDNRVDPEPYLFGDRQL